MNDEEKADLAGMMAAHGFLIEVLLAQRLSEETEHRANEIAQGFIYALTKPSTPIAGDPEMQKIAESCAYHAERILMNASTRASNIRLNAKARS